MIIFCYHSIFCLITYGGDNQTFIWKSPIEDFNLGSSLTVGESQEALFFKDGQALDLFGPGQHILETKNIPLLGKAVNLLYGNDTPFHCSIYFINKVDQLAIKWGTDTKVEYLDPIYSFPLKIGMSGEMTLAVDNPRALIIKLVGGDDSYSQDKAVDQFKGLLLSRLKPFIARYMVENRINIFEVDAHLEAFSSELEKMMTPEYAEYGMALKRMYVNTVVKPEGERDYEKFKALHYRKYTDVESARLEQELATIQAQTEAVKMGIEAEALAKKRQTEGYTYQQQMGFEVAKEAAANEASGQFTGMGIGLGAMAGVGGAVGGALNESITGAFNQSPQPTGSSQNPAPEQATGSQNNEDPIQVLTRLKTMLENGLIEQSEYDQKKKEILERM